MIIIGLCGKKRVGKNYCAQQAMGIMADRGIYPVMEAAFADPIKAYLENVLGIDSRLLCGSDEEKNKPTEYLWDGFPPYIRKGRSGPMSARECMQVFGTELNRDIWGPMVWVKAMGRKMKWAEDHGMAAALITDVRFPNEGDAIHELGGVVWRIVGPHRGESASEKDGHASEAAIDDVECDRVIDNSGDPGSQLMDGLAAANCLSRKGGAARGAARNGAARRGILNV